jgi:yeast amino acid transporter
MSNYTSHDTYCCYAAITLAGIKGLKNVINALILVFVLSAANSDLYIGSRTLYALAIEGKAPSIFRRVNRMGVPLPALILCTAFCCLVFLNVHESTQKGVSGIVICLPPSSLISFKCSATLPISSRLSVPSLGCASVIHICE